MTRVPSATPSSGRAGSPLPAAERGDAFLTFTGNAPTVLRQIEATTHWKTPLDKLPIITNQVISLLTRRCPSGSFVFERTKISLLATRHKTFRHRFQFLPAGADLFGLRRSDLAVGGGGGDDGEEVGEFLDDLVGGRDEEMRMRRVLGVDDEKAAGALANPLDVPVVAGAGQQRLDAVERVAGAAARGVVRRFGPFVNHGKRQAEVGGDLFGGLFVENLAQQFVGVHDETMEKQGGIGKREAVRQKKPFNNNRSRGC